MSGTARQVKVVTMCRQRPGLIRMAFVQKYLHRGYLADMLERNT